MGLNAPKRKRESIPTIHFQVLSLLVLGMVIPLPTASFLKFSALMSNKWCGRQLGKDYTTWSMKHDSGSFLPSFPFLTLTWSMICSPCCHEECWQLGSKCQPELSTLPWWQKGDFWLLGWRYIIGKTATFDKYGTSSNKNIRTLFE